MRRHVLQLTLFRVPRATQYGVTHRLLAILVRRPEERVIGSSPDGFVYEVVPRVRATLIDVERGEIEQRVVGPHASTRLDGGLSHRRLHFLRERDERRADERR